MQYYEYLTEVDGLEKKVGILGEIHIYTSLESIFAHSVIPNYETIAMEGPKKGSTPFFFCVGLLYVPVILAYMAGTNRSFNNPTAKAIAKIHRKEIITLEDDTDQLFPFTQKLAFGLVGLLSIPISPYLYFKYKMNGDPFEHGTKNYEKKMKRKKSLVSKLTSYAYFNNLEQRDRVMAERSIDLLRSERDNLLIVCGEAHVPGITENLRKQLDLEEVIKPKISLPFWIE